MHYIVMPLKNLILTFFLIILVTPAFGSTVTCQSEDGAWTVDFELQEDVIKNLNFTKAGNLVASFDEVQGIRTRIFKRHFFEFELGGIKYLDFDKRIDGKNFEANFLLKNNPFAFDNTVTCKIEE
jgi:hypothetical protein